MIRNAFLGGALSLIIPVGLEAATVDLTSWKENGYPNNNAGVWTVQGTGNDSVFQGINGRPTVFFDQGNNAHGKQLGGEITVETAVDDDFVGFVLGYQDGEINSSNADFWLIDWKKGDQSGQTAGLALNHVSGNMSGLGTGTSGEWWQHTAPINEKLRANSLGTTGWNHNQKYVFSLEFTPSLIKVTVDGSTELEFTSADNGGQAFSNGSFGFYNFSQQSVRYAGITQTAAPSAPNVIPLPASLPLILVGLGALGILRRRKVR